MTIPKIIVQEALEDLTLRWNVNRINEPERVMDCYSIDYITVSKYLPHIHSDSFCPVSCS